MIVTFPAWTVTDDTGALISGANVTIASVKDKAGSDIASHGATVNLSGPNVSIDYDPEAKGDAWVTLAISKAATAFTGINAAPSVFLARDPGRILGGLPSTGLVVANATQLAGQAITASAGVAFPAAVASQTNAPSWYQTADLAAIAQAVWNYLQSSLGMGATMGQLVKSFGAYTDPWTATGATLLSPPPTVNGFTVNTSTLKGSIALPAVVAINLDAYRGRHFRVSEYNPGTGAVGLRDPLPTSPPTDVGFAVEFQADNPRTVDLAQPILDVQTATVGGALAGSWAYAWGKQVLDKVSKMLRLWGPGNTTNTPSYNFSLDDADDPTNRTPAA